MRNPQKPLGGVQWAGCLLVFAGLLTEVLEKALKPKLKPKPAEKPVERTLSEPPAWSTTYADLPTETKAD